MKLTFTTNHTCLVKKASTPTPNPNSPTRMYITFRTTKSDTVSIPLMKCPYRPFLLISSFLGFALTPLPVQVALLVQFLLMLLFFTKIEPHLHRGCGPIISLTPFQSVIKVITFCYLSALSSFLLEPSHL